MSYFNESNTVEEMLINAAGERGWIYVESSQVPRLPDEVFVTQWLQTALLELNPITPEQAEQVIYKLRAAVISCNHFDDLVAANDKFRSLLFEENSYPFGPMVIISTSSSSMKICQRTVALSLINGSFHASAMKEANA